MKKQSKPRRQILILGVLVLLCFLWIDVTYLFIPRLSILQEKTALVSQRAAYLAELQKNYRNYSAIKAQAVSFKAEVAKLDQDIPKIVDKPQIMLTVYNLAKSNGIKPISLKFEPLKEQGSYSSMTMTFFCSGPTENMLTLVEQFQKGKIYLFALNSININQGNQQATASMSITAYFYK